MRLQSRRKGLPRRYVTVSSACISKPRPWTPVHVPRLSGLPAVRFSALLCNSRLARKASGPFVSESLARCVLQKSASLLFSSSFRWRVESRLQSPQVANSSHGSLTCKACRRVESEGPCVRPSAVFIGWLRRGLVGCRKC